MHVIPCLEMEIPWPEPDPAVPWPTVFQTIPWPQTVLDIAWPDIRQLIQIRLLQNDANREEGSGYVISCIVVVELGDTAHQVEQEVVSALRNIPVSQPIDAEFVPVFEWVIEHPTCYELAFIHCDREYGVCVFVPKLDGIDADLLTVCAEHAIPVGISPVPVQASV